MSDMEQLQAAIIQLHAMEQEKERVNARLAKLKADCRVLELGIIVMMNENGIDTLGHAGVLARLKGVIHYSPVSGDGWQRIYARIQRTGEFELLHKRLSSTAVREHFKAGDLIDGVQAVTVPTLDLTYQGGE